jgi:hypothetical protein
MHHIKWHDNRRYVTCGYPDGDKKDIQSCVVYNSEYFNIDRAIKWIFCNLKYSYMKTIE